MEPVMLCNLLTYGLMAALGVFFVLSVASGLSVWHWPPYLHKRHW